MSLTNHKGQPCIVDNRLCQEGYCEECCVQEKVLASLHLDFDAIDKSKKEVSKCSELKFG
jgi:hypothetical protein